MIVINGCNIIYYYTKVPIIFYCKKKKKIEYTKIHLRERPAHPVSSLVAQCSTIVFYTLYILLYYYMKYLPTG